MSKLTFYLSRFNRTRPRLCLLAVAGMSVLMLSGCAGPAYLNGGYSGYSGPYYDTGYPGPYTGPYYGSYGPYTDIVVGGGGYYGGHHFYGHSFGHGSAHFGSSHGGGFHGGVGRSGGGRR
jgi:hypothetical protein